MVSVQRDRAARHQPQPNPPMRGPQFDELLPPEPKLRKKLVNFCRTSVDLHSEHTLSLSFRNPARNTSTVWLHVLQTIS